MTSIETTPLINDTTVIEHQNQILVSRPELTPAICNSFDTFYREITPFSTQQLNIPALAGMQRYNSNFLWKTSDNQNDEIFEIELDINTLRTFAPLGLDQQTFMNAKQVKISFHNTNNAFYQGGLLVYYDPSSSPDFFKKVYNIDLTLADKFQFKVWKLIEPKNRNGMSFIADIIIPFNLFKYNGNNPPIRNYVRNYSYGSIKVCVASPLETKSPTLSLNYRVTTEIIGYSTAGNNFD
jgi:hypothetical protein